MADDVSFNRSELERERMRLESLRLEAERRELAATRARAHELTRCRDTRTIKYCGPLSWLIGLGLCFPCIAMCPVDVMTCVDEPCYGPLKHFQEQARALDEPKS